MSKFKSFALFTILSTIATTGFAAQKTTKSCTFRDLPQDIGRQVGSKFLIEGSVIKGQDAKVRMKEVVDLRNSNWDATFDAKDFFGRIQFQEIVYEYEESITTNRFGHEISLSEGCVNDKDNVTECRQYCFVKFARGDGIN